MKAINCSIRVNFKVTLCPFLVRGASSFFFPQGLSSASQFVVDEPSIHLCTIARIASFALLEVSDALGLMPVSP